MNSSFTNLYGFYTLSDKQIDYYVDAYLGFVRKEFVTIIVNEKDEVVACAITLPSISKALQKAKGKLYPFGFIHLLQAFRKNDTCLLYTSPSPRDLSTSRMPSSA